MLQRTLIGAIVALLIAIAPQTAYAQSASGSYNNGVQAMQSSQWDVAIGHFETSMRLNGNASNKKKCNSKIAECYYNKGLGAVAQAKRTNNKQLYRTAESYFKRSMSYDGGNTNAAKCRRQLDEISATRTANPTLVLANHSIDFECEASYSNVSVAAEPNQDEWTIHIASSDTAWLHATQEASGDTLHLLCDANTSSERRQTTVVLTYGNVSDSIVVSQSGQVVIEVEGVADGGTKSMDLDLFTGTMRAIGLSGKKKTFYPIPVYSTSDVTLDDGRNWRVVELPSWVQVESYSNLSDKLKNAVSESVIRFLRGKGIEWQRMDMSQFANYALIIFVEPLPAPFKKMGGRKGDIVIESGGRQFRFTLCQTK